MTRVMVLSSFAWIVSYVFFNMQGEFHLNENTCNSHVHWQSNIYFIVYEFILVFIPMIIGYFPYLTMVIITILSLIQIIYT